MCYVWLPLLGPLLAQTAVLLSGLSGEEVRLNVSWLSDLLFLLFSGASFAFSASFGGNRYLIFLVAAMTCGSLGAFDGISLFLQGRHRMTVQNVLGLCRKQQAAEHEDVTKSLLEDKETDDSGAQYV